MSEEVFISSEADELTQRIASRLGERQQKLMQMGEWDKTTRQVRRRPLYIVTAVAACAVIALLMTPLWKSPSSPLDELEIERPTLTEYRAASPEMSEMAALIEQNHYEEAIVKVEKALRHSDFSLREFSGLGEAWNDESLMYEEDAEMVRNSELRWTYIYILVRMERNDEARKEIRRYLKNPFAEHKKEAKALLKALS